MLLTEHHLTIEATCPKDGSTDTYNTYVRTTSLVAVEKILAAVKHITDRPIYQEELTRKLAHMFPQTVEVETHGIHSGVYTTCRYSA